MAQLEFVAPELWNYIAQSNDPPALKIIEGRYLFVQHGELTQGDATFFPPSGTFNLLNGRAVEGFRDFQGAFVYDTKLKRWGRMDVSPVEPGV